MENNNDNLESGSLDFLQSDWYQAVKRQSAKEATAVLEAMQVLQKAFEIRSTTFGHQGDQFEKNESTLIFKLKSTHA